MGAIERESKYIDEKEKRQHTRQFPRIDKNCNGECNDAASPLFQRIVTKKCKTCLQDYKEFINENMKKEQETNKTKNLNELKKNILYHLERNTRSSGNKLHLTAYPYIINLLIDIKEELVKLNGTVGQIKRERR